MSLESSHKSKLKRIDDKMLWTALKLSPTETPEPPDSKQGMLFKTIKSHLRDIVEANMDWHRTYSQQTDDALNSVIADIKEKFPDLSADPIALDAMVRYTKIWFQGAHCAFVNKLGRGKASRRSQASKTGGISSANIRVQSEQSRSVRALSPPCSAYESQEPLGGSSLDRPSPMSSESSRLSSNSPPSSSSITDAVTMPATARLPVANHELFNFMQSCNPALNDLFEKGLDLKTLALAFHLAQLFEGRVDHRGQQG
ncbi:hypothetical protein HWV62_24570 [Athelia sp. TMB]|nr:hypothetical protein HWV62_24570 [Athelia sp. TMB]